MFLQVLLVAALAGPAFSARPDHGAAQELVEPDPETLVRQDPTQSVMMLNRHTFNTTVAQPHVDNWVVFFCVDWLELCQGLWHDYRRMAMHWEQALAPHAKSWQTAAVRFAEVDCAKEKALCNENNVQNYPSVIHFKDGKFAREWELSKGATSLSTDISKWISKVLSAQKSDQASKSTTHAAPELSLANHLRELSGLLSWNDPRTAAIGYFILAIVVAIFAWVIGTGLELELKAVLSCFSKDAKLKQWPSALLPDLPEMPEPRTIVRNSIVL